MHNGGLRAEFVRLLLVAALVIGCAEPAEPVGESVGAPLVETRTVPVCIDARLSGTDRIVAAVDFWNAALTGVVLEPMITDECPVGGVPIRLSGECKDHPACTSGSFEGGDVRIGVTEPGFFFGREFAIAIHELGHVLGSGHHPGTFMGPTYDSAWEGVTCVPKVVAGEVSSALGNTPRTCTE
jgi:hypothetical protein